MTDSPRIIVLFGNIALFGQERANIDALHALQGLGCVVLFLVRKEAWARPLRDELSALDLNWIVAPFPPHRWGRGLSIAQLLQNLLNICTCSVLLRRMIREFRATHLHVADPVWVLAFLPALIVSRLPLIYSATDAPGPLSPRPWRWIWRFIYWRVSIFVAISDFVRQRLLLDGASSQTVTLVYGRPPVRSRSPERFSLVKDRFRFVYIGQISNHKGMDILLDALRILKKEGADFEFLIAGPLDGIYCQRIAHEVRADLASHVRLLNQVSDIDGLLSVADVHVCPSIFEEPLGLVVMEAKRAGVPSIVFPSGGLPEMITHGQDGYVCSKKSAEVLAEAMIIYLKNPDRAAQEGKHALLSLNKFWPVEFGDAWKRIYAETATKIPICQRHSCRRG
jgi:glycosyltransferase involved in cell wall biosynthesis